MTPKSPPFLSFAYPMKIAPKVRDYFQGIFSPPILCVLSKLTLKEFPPGGLTKGTAMNRQHLRIAFGLLILGSFAVFTADAQETTFSKQIATKVDPEASTINPLPVSFYYDPVIGEERLFDGSLRVHLCLGLDHADQLRGPLVAEVRLTDLRHSGRTHVRYVPLVIDRDVFRGNGVDPASSPNPVSQETNKDNQDYQFRVVRYAHFDLDNRSWEAPLLAPARVYRLFVHLHRKAASQGQHTRLGQVPYPYYTATSGSTRLDRARKKIVMRTFKEFYYRLNGWRTGENYPMDCYAYYMWATGFCTVGSQNGRTQLHNLFDKQNPYNLGSHIPELSGEGPIHGDYVRVPGHSFMLLSYDPERGQVWTMEGNFNSTVEVVVRKVSPGWQVGHLRDRHIAPNLFGIFPDRPRLFSGFGG